MYTHEFKFNNGDSVIDKITEFKGSITGRVIYITGCNQYLVTAKSLGNGDPIGLWIDEGRLFLDINKKSFTLQNDVKEPGCDKTPPGGKRGF